MTDAELLEQFEQLTLPFEHWTHQAHVRVAFIYLQRFDFEQALDRLRAGIKAFNAHNNVPESATSGYNETTTHAFANLIAATMHAYGEQVPVADSLAFCEAHPQLMTRHVLRLFYSPQCRMNPMAKATFIPPDLAPLPRRK